MNINLKYNSILNKKTRAKIKIQLADVFGISQPTIYSWLSGRVIPPVRYQSKIAEIMGTEVSELFPVKDNNSEVTIKNAK